MASFIVDTGGPRGAACFMCLKTGISSSSSSSCSKNKHSNPSNLLPFRLLTRYLGVEFGKVFQQGGLGIRRVSPPGVTQVGVPLCGDCAELTGKFSALYQELEVIRLQTEAVVRKIHGVMVVGSEEAEERKRKKERQKRGMEEVGSSITTSTSSSSSLSLSDKLRRELVLKCSRLLSKGNPRVRLERNNNFWKDYHLLQKKKKKNHNSSTTTASISSSPPASGSGGHHMNSPYPTSPSSGGGGGDMDMLSDPEEEGISCDDDGDDDDDDNEAKIIKEEPTSESEEEESENDYESTLELEPPLRSANTTTAAATTTSPEQRISFRRVGPDRYKCGICSKVVRGLSITTHKLSHVVVGVGGDGDRPFACSFCTKAFRSQGNLSDHKAVEHRSSFFSQYKEPSCSSEQFEKHIKELFNAGLVITQVGLRAYSCPFCDSVQQSRGRVKSHALRHHKEEELVPRLMALQKGGGGVLEPAVVEEPAPNSAVEDVSQSDDGILKRTRGPNLKPSSRSKILISFRDLPGGKVQCSICSKVLLRTSIRNHHSTHSLGRLHKCHLCPKSFRHSNNLWDHKYTDHPAAFLRSYKVPNCSSLQFERLVTEFMLEGVDIPQLAVGAFRCTYCGATHQSKTRVRNHLVRHHMKELGPKLTELQQKNILSDTGPQGVSGSRVDSTRSSTETSLTKRRRLTSESEVKTEEVPDLEDPQEELELPQLDCVPTSERSSYSKSKQQKELHQFPFKTLPSGKLECGLCSKVVLQSSVRIHKLSHSGGKQFQCDSCPKCFRYSQGLTEHRYAEHRSSLFAQYKPPEMSPEQFESMLVKLFSKMPISNKCVDEEDDDDGGVYSCGFCGGGAQRSKSRVETHILRHHMDKLVPILEELQKKKNDAGPPVLLLSGGETTRVEVEAAVSHQTSSVLAAAAAALPDFSKSFASKGKDYWIGGVE